MTIQKNSNELPSIWDDSRLRSYLGEINRKHGIVDTLALPNMRDLPPIRIESLFVQPLLSQMPVSPLNAPETWPEGLSLFNTLQSSPRLVLLGDPGSGKTTLVNWLAWRLSGGFTTPLPSILENCLPIPCVLREMKSTAFASKVTVADLAILVAEQLLGAKVNAPLKASIRAHVEAKRYVLILDGVDEISITKRKNVAVWMQQASEDEVCALATSRTVGYDDHPICNALESKDSSGKRLTFTLNSPFINENNEEISIEFPPSSVPHNIQQFPWLHENKTQTFWDLLGKKNMWAEKRYLMPFDQKRITAFVGNWYLQRSASEHEAAQKTEDLIFALSQSETTQELARTPNLLSLMAIVHRERAHLPDGKALLYKEIANAYINTIDQHRNITEDDALTRFGWEIRENWIAFIGFQMQLERCAAATNGAVSKENETGVLVSQEKVLSWLSTAMEESGVSKAQLSAQVFLEWVARRSGLLLPRGDNLFAFVHLSFQEYFCARYLTSRIISPKFIKDQLSEDASITKVKLSEWADQSLWREILIYALELISGERSTEWVDDLLEILFGSAVSKETSGSPDVELSVRILTNRHIHACSDSKRNLVNFASKSALIQWTSIRQFDSTFRALLRTKYASIYLPKNVESHLRFSNVQINEFSQLDEITFEPDLCILIIECGDVEDISVLGKLENLRHLILTGSHVEDISSLSALNKLNTLELKDASVKDITPIRGMTELVSLDLKGSLLEDISSLSRLKDLRSIKLSGNPISDISSLAGISNLTNLNLSNTRIESITPLKGLTSLTALNIDNTAVKSIIPLKGLLNLANLNAKNTLLANITPLKTLQNLIFLDLSGTQIKNINDLTEINKLTFLLLKNTKIKDVSPLAKLANLRILQLDNCQIESIDAIIGTNSIMHLSLRNTNLTDISALKNMSELRTLDLSETSINDISILANLKFLEVLKITNTPIEDISTLSKIKSLRSVSLKGAQVRDISALNRFTADGDGEYRRVPRRE
jgi:Leucine-rich repeat (LRR) protein